MNSLAPMLIALAALLAYHNSFKGSFLLDDIGSILNNPSIHRLWPLWETLSPPADQTVGGRPLVNLTLALNHAWGGANVWGYHAVNVAVHILAALTLFGLTRRTLQSPPLNGRFGRSALSLALAATLLWTAHPLQTESVTYIVQRSESLASLFYLLTLYFAMRAAGSGRPLLWRAAAIVACLLGMASKEIVSSAPLMVFLYDRTFLAGSFREAWRTRRGFYLVLASTWFFLAFQVLATGHRGDSVIFEFSSKWVAYVLTQFVAIATYLRLAVWPSPLVFDYGYARADGPEIVLGTTVVLLLLGLTLLALRRWPTAGFLGAWFFAVIASSSSIVPIRTQPLAEHRMYLPLAAVAVLVVTAAYRGWRRIEALARQTRALRLLPAAVLGCVIAVFIWLTFRRNEDYRSAVAMWQDTVRKRPDNPRAHNNLAEALLAEGNAVEAIAHYQEVLRIKPDLFTAANDLGKALVSAGRLPEAIAVFRQLTELRPSYIEGRSGLSFALLKAGRTAEAIVQLEWLVRMQPEEPQAHFNLAAAKLESGALPEAIAHLQQAVRLQPGFVKAYNNLGHAFNSSGRQQEALAPLEKALQMDPNDYFVRYTYAASLSALGRKTESRDQLAAALRLAQIAGDTGLARDIQSRLQQLR